MMAKLNTFLLCILLALSLLACSKDEKKQSQTKTTHIITAKLKVPVKRYYFTGVLNPIEVRPVVAPVQGNIAHMNFEYGSWVKKGDTIVTIDSHTLAQDFRKAISDYLQKKQTYTTGQGSFEGEQALYNAGVVSKEEYQSKKAAFENSLLSYLQAQYHLHKVLKMTDVSFKEISSLTIETPEKINKILQKHFHHVHVLSNYNGIALFPTSSGSGSDDDKKITVGMSVKQDQLLVNIGDLSGFVAQLNVSEVMINSVHKGMPVKVTGTAFPGIELKGMVSAVSSQAHTSDSSGMSMFAVTVRIPHLSKKASKAIRVGMSATFELDTKLAPKIILPIQAVTRQKGQAVVTILDASGEHKKMPVITGHTTPTTVVILSGLKVGQRVVVPSD